MKKTRLLMVAALAAAVSAQAQLLIDFDNSPVAYSLGDINGQDAWGGTTTGPDVGVWNNIAFGDNPGESNELRCVAGKYAYREITSEVDNITVVKTLVSTYSDTTYGTLRIAVGSYLSGDAVVNLTLDSRVGIKEVYQGSETIASSNNFVHGTDYEVEAMLDFDEQIATIEVTRLIDGKRMGKRTVAFLNAKTLAEAQANTQILLASTGNSTFWDNVEVVPTTLPAPVAEFIDFDTSPTNYTAGDIVGQDGWQGYPDDGTGPDVSTLDQITQGGLSNELRTTSTQYAYREITGGMDNVSVVKTLVSTHDDTTFATLRIAVGYHHSSHSVVELVLDSRAAVKDVHQGTDYITFGDSFVQGTDYEVEVMLNFSHQEAKVTVTRLIDSAVMGTGTVPFPHTKTLAEAQAYTQLFLYSSGSSTFWDDISVAPQFGIETLGVFHETFETNSPIMASEIGVLDGQHGWSDLSLQSTVQSSEAWEGSQAASFGNTQISNGIGGSNANVQIAFAWKPAAGVFDGESIPSDATVVFWANEIGSITAYSNSTPVVVSGAAVDTNAWSRMLVESDYTAEQWSLWLDGVQVVDGFGFYANTLDRIHEVSFRSLYSGAPAYVDDVLVLADDLWTPQPGDTDGDGLEDDWEVYYFQSPHTLSSGSGDYDSDGQTDGEEEIAYTDPTDSGSVFAITDEGVASATEFVIHWPSVAGRVYAVDASTNLVEGGWSNIESDIAATPPENMYTVTVDSESARFIRVSAEKE